MASSVVGESKIEAEMISGSGRGWNTPDEGVEIAALEPRIVSVPLADPVHMSGEVVSAAQNLIVKITDTDGATGWGEAASAPMMTGELPSGLLDAAKFMAVRLPGMRLSVGNLTAETEPLIYHNHGAKSAVRLAVLDLIARRHDVPLYDLLGGMQRKRAAALILLASRDVPETEHAVRLVDSGVTALKVKVGLGSVGADLARAAAVRAAVGPEVRISADANMAFDLDQALQFMAGAEDAGLDFVDQPVDGDDLQAMRACAEASTVPVCADEGLHGLADIKRHHDAGAARGGNLKLVKLGGPEGVLAGAKLLNDLGMRVNLVCKVAETSIAGAAMAHLAVAVAQVDWDVSITNQYLADDIVRHKMTLEDGCFAPPSGPGLGIEIDEAKLDRYTSAR
jgi:muconate cycloisomerase